jgi:hypothetical protein
LLLLPPLLLLLLLLLVQHPHSTTNPQSAKIFGDGVWFKTNAAALTPEGANILGLGFGLGNNLPVLFVSTVSDCCLLAVGLLCLLCVCCRFADCSLCVCPLSSSPP